MPEQDTRPSGHDTEPAPGFGRLFSKMQPVVFFGSAALVVGFCLFGGLATELAGDWFSRLREAITLHFGWYYALAASTFLGFCVWLMFSQHGRVRLGPPDSRPEFSTLSWVTMLFAAGMGTGLVFWSVAEPLTHLAEPPFAEPGTAKAASEAMHYTWFHWGLHPWAIYACLGVAIAYFHFRRDLPLAPRSILFPLIGQRAHGLMGHLVDILCTVGTLLGVATSLGLGAMQINAGAERAMGVPIATASQLWIIGLITAVATLSVVLGLHGGIRRLSLLNLGLALLMLAFVFVAGPTVGILEILVSTFGQYLQNLPRSSFAVGFMSGGDWHADWTLFYWGWWISWSPFVGIFVARISKGRTIREFLAMVLFVPSLATFFWLSVFGGTALHMQLVDGTNLAGPISEHVALSLHLLLENMPLSQVTSILATLLVTVFFITSSDSGSWVDDMVTSGGHPNPPRAQRVFWACSEGAVAMTLLVVGGLRSLQDASIVLGLPMSLVLVAACVALIRGLRTSTESQVAN